MQNTMGIADLRSGHSLTESYRIYSTLKTEYGRSGASQYYINKTWKVTTDKSTISILLHMSQKSPGQRTVKRRNIMHHSRQERETNFLH